MEKLESLKRELAAIEAAKNELRGGVPASQFIAPTKEIDGALDALYEKGNKLQREYDIALMNKAESFGLMNCPMNGWQRISATERANIEALVADRTANNAPTTDGSAFIFDLD